MTQLELTHTCRPKAKTHWQLFRNRFALFILLREQDLIGQHFFNAGVG